jgi:hypothetical protein
MLGNNKLEFYCLKYNSKYFHKHRLNVHLK